MKYYWLYTESYVYISINKNRVLFLNTLNGFFYISQDKKIVEIAKAISTPLNMRTIQISENELNTSPISDLIFKLRESFSGDIININESKVKPIQLPPEIKYVTIGAHSKENALGNRITDKIHELTIYINDECKQKCLDCKGYSKQFLSCKKTLNKHRELPFEAIIRLIENNKQNLPKNLNIIGGNILLYSDFFKLYNYLSKLNIVTSYYIEIKNLIDFNLSFLTSKNSYLILLVNSNTNLAELQKIKEHLKLLNCEFHFMIDSEQKFFEVEEVTKKLNIDFIIHPFFNNCNIEFFEKNVFIGLNDLFNNNYSYESIIEKSILNRNYYGKLIIDVDGNIYSNLNHSKLGNITNLSLKEAAFKEFRTHNNWRKSRKNIKICNKCIFNLICPPPSNYEIAIGKPNLCHIQP